MRIQAEGNDGFFPTESGSYPAPPTNKPLGRGYDGFPEFFLCYARDSKAPHSPELGRSLRAFLTEPAAQILGAVGDSPVCLVEGISCPSNGISLRHCLARAGVSNPSIHAVDILDVEAVADSFGYELPGISFSVGDASRLSAWGDASVRVLVQDHLLNCAPHAMHPAIIREAARVLHPRGVWILNFSLEPRLAAGRELPFAEAERLLGCAFGNMDYCLSEAARDGRSDEFLAEHLLGQLVVDERTGRRILITPPYGNFEFYFPLPQLERMLSACNLETVFRSCEHGLDEHGNAYQRHRTLVRRAEDRSSGDRAG